MSTDYIKEVTLPSNGTFYGGAIPGGSVVVEPMSTKQEKLFATGSSADAVLDKVFSACVKNLPISPLDLVLGDRLYLLLMIRSVSYGDEYTFAYQCAECREKNWHHLRISDIPVIRADEESSPEFSVHLPLSGVDLEARLLTGKDEKQVAQYVKQFKSKTRGAGGDMDYVYRLALRIKKINGEEVGIREALSFIEDMQSPDSLALRDAIDENDVGPDLIFEIDCDNCGYPNEEVMAFTSEFFRPRRKSSRTRKRSGGTALLDP